MSIPASIPKNPPANWQTTAVPKRKSNQPWKSDLGEACPHGRRIVIVDGTYVRNHFDSDFSQGGNGYRYKFIPKDEIWIDFEIREEEWPFIAFHECQESEEMKKGMSYDKAHDQAKRLEDRQRAFALRSPREYLDDSNPNCPVCGHPSNDIAYRKDPREWLSTFGMKTFVSCKPCWIDASEEN
jgi:hypothetical protein